MASRKRIDNARGHVGYTKIVCLLEKPAGSSRCRYPGIHGYVALVTRARIKSPRERDSVDPSKHLRVPVTVVHLAQISFSLFPSLSLPPIRAFFTLFGQGGLFRARVRKCATLSSRSPVSPLSLSIERSLALPAFSSKPPQMCAEIRRARRIGGHQTRAFRDSAITRKSR